ncbi:MAG: hypothetical protein WAN48_06585 [Actinomycetes bacterium]
MTVSPPATSASSRRLWHVTVTLAGEPLELDDVRSALARFAERHQFLLSGRYATNRAEIRYWEEGAHMRDTAARALLLWADHADVAALPPWEVVGLEVVDQETFHARGQAGELLVTPVGSGDLRPF